MSRRKAEPWRERGGSDREHGVKRMSSTLTKDGFQREEGEQAIKASLQEHEEDMSE